MKYYRRESGTIVKVDENMQIFYLDKNKNWVNDQELIDMFIEDLDLLMKLEIILNKLQIVTYFSFKNCC